MKDQPLVCTLSPPELRQRRREVLEPLRAAALEVKALATGIALRFPAEGGAGLLVRLAELIELERSCCPFLRFELTVEPAGGPLWLTLTGPPGTAEVLAAELGLTAC